MIQIKKLIPMRCKILKALGFTSMSRMFASCSIGVRPYKGCEGCENNVREQMLESFYEAFQRGMNDGLKQRKELLLRLENGGRCILTDCEHINHCETPLYVGECKLECLRRAVTELDAKKGGAE